MRRAYNILEYRQLNKYKTLRHFVKTEGEADSYSDLSVKYIQGHVPELVMFEKDDSGAFTETVSHRIDITEKDVRGEDMSEARLQALHEYLAGLGFLRSKVEL